MRGAVRKFVILAIGLLPAAALAEGAVRILECRAELACNGAGACEPASGETTFSMEPRQLDANGSGSYEISYGELRAPMDARSFAGPFTWDLDGTTHTLLANSETRFLWHRLAFEPAPSAKVNFLRCEFTQ